jgi:hypothetical protein
MKSFQLFALAGAVALVAALGVSSAQAGFGRQYYGGWRPSGHGYSFSTYHYNPYASYPSYCYNYAIWYPTTPRYVYYFNPYKGTYWGRFDVLTKGYSLLAEKDRAGQLKDIPEKAFPAAGPLPQVPDAKDQLTLAEPLDLPVGEKVDAAAAAPDKADDLPTTLGNDQTPPADPKLDKPVPATPAEKPAPATPAGGPAPAVSGGPAAPAGGPAAPAGGVAPVDPQVTPAPGIGVAAPAEPVNPAPVGGGTPAGGTVAPAPGGVAPPSGGPAPVRGPVFPSSCHKQFGGGHRHGYGW